MLVPMRSVVLLSLLAACGAPRSADAGLDAAPADGAALDAGADAHAPEADARSTAGRAEAPLPAALQELAIAVLEDRIVVAGGFEGATIVSTVRAYDPQLQSWATLPELPEPRHHLMLAVHGADLYALGGMASVAFDTVDTAWVLREGASAWAGIAALPDARAAGAAVTIGDAIYIAAGQGARGELVGPTYVYSVTQDSWSTAASIPTPREHTSGFVHEGELWVVAGRMNSLSTNLDAVEIYDPILDAWRAGPPIPTARGGHGCAVWASIAYCVGGEEPRQALDSVEAIDLATGIWTGLEPVPTPRHGHGVAAVGGRVYVVGGADRPIFAAVDAVESLEL